MGKPRVTSQEGTINRGPAPGQALGTHPLGNPHEQLRPGAGLVLAVRWGRGGGAGPGRWGFPKVFHVILMCIRPRPVGSAPWFLNLGLGVTEPPGGRIKRRAPARRAWGS